MDQSYLYRFGLSINNLGHLLQDRGYNVTTVDATNATSAATNAATGSIFTDDPFKTMGRIYAIAKSKQCSLGEAVRSTFLHSSRPTLSIWCLDRNYDSVRQRDRMISTEQVKYLCDVMNSENTNIVLSPNKLSPQARKEMPKHAELFLFEDLFIDLPRHVLCVEHQVITLEKLRSVLGETMQSSDLPVLLPTDPMVRWYGWAAGTIVFLKNPVMNSFRCVI